MRSVVNNREFLTRIDSDGIILQGLKQSIGIAFYLAKQENDGKINVKIINRIEGR
jgi:hypothetical protein